MSTESRLRQAMSDHVADVTASPDLLAGVQRRHRSRVVRNRALTVAGLAALAVGVLPVYGLVTADGDGHVSASRGGSVSQRPKASPLQQPPAGVTSCALNVPIRVIPPWARSGFSAAEPRMAYVLGARGDIVAILFGSPLAAPPRQNLSNKILWVSRVPLVAGDSLVIDASLEGTATRVTRTVRGGPGPSGVDLPEAGCWHLTLKWSGHTDTMDLRYSHQPG
ncbi:MAG: hypothetical protein JWL58_2254 [Streptosporangiaceae bacterium]|jgi:hypothetical protein|nr:hypothetical protein [Streptosporangiaceae bacterium]